VNTGGAGRGPVYDRIGQGYTATRSPNPRIAAAIEAALGDARSVVNRGAGSGAGRRPTSIPGYAPGCRASRSFHPAWPTAGLARLEDDLRSGRWHARFGGLCGQEAADLGYRLVIGLSREFPDGA
jgi:hypothetical protein